jgi:hypothetical protein
MDISKWANTITDKTVEGYENVRDSKAVEIGKKTAIGAGSGAVGAVKDTRSIADVANLQQRVAVGAVKGGLNANGVDTSGVDTVMDITSTDPRQKLELAAQAARKLEEYRKKQDSDREAFPKAGDAGSDMQKREKNGETQFKLTTPTGIYGVASDINDSRTDTTVDDYLVADDKERAEKDDPEVTEHRRYLAKKADSNYGKTRTNQEYLQKAYDEFDAQLTNLHVHVWLILAEAKFNPNTWITPSAVLKKHYPNHKPSQTLSASGKNQLLAMCSLSIEAESNLKVKFFSAVSSFVAHGQPSGPQTPVARTRIVRQKNQPNKYSFAFAPYTHWTKPGPYSDYLTLPRACNITFCGYAELPPSDSLNLPAESQEVWGYRWHAYSRENSTAGKDMRLRDLMKLHLHGPNGETDWMMTTAEIDKLEQEGLG